MPILNTDTIINLVRKYLFSSNNYLECVNESSYAGICSSTEKYKGIIADFKKEWGNYCRKCKDLLVKI